MIKLPPPDSLRLLQFRIVAILIFLFHVTVAFSQFEGTELKERLGESGTKLYKSNLENSQHFFRYAERFSKFGRDANGNETCTYGFELKSEEWPCDSMYECWRRVYDGAPFYSKSIYVYGATMLDSMSLNANKSDAERLLYFQDLMQIYEDRIRRLDSLNSIEKDDRFKSTKFGIMVKAADVYWHTAPRVKGSGYTREKAYQNFVNAFDLIKNSGTADNEVGGHYLVHYFLACKELYKYDEEKYTEQFLIDYITCLERCDRMKAVYINYDEVKWENYAWAYDEIQREFQQSGAASPQKLIPYFSPRIEEHAKDIVYLNNVVYLLFYNGLTSNDAFFNACEKAYFIKPGFENCIGMGQMSLTIDKDRIGAKKYFDEAWDIAKDAKERYWAALFTGNALSSTPRPPKISGEDNNTRNAKLREWFVFLRAACAYYSLALENAHEAGVDDQTKAGIYWKIANCYYHAQEYDKARENKNLILACYPKFIGDIQDLSAKIEKSASAAAERAKEDERKRRKQAQEQANYEKRVALQKAEDDFWKPKK